MNSVTHENVTLVSRSESIDRSALKESLIQEKNDLEIDMIEVLAIIWRVRSYLLAGTVIGLIFGTVLALAKIESSQSNNLTQHENTPPITLVSEYNFQNDFLIRVKDPSLNTGAFILNELNNTLTLRHSLRLFYEKMTLIWKPRQSYGRQNLLL